MEAETGLLEFGAQDDPAAGELSLLFCKYPKESRCEKIFAKQRHREDSRVMMREAIFIIPGQVSCRWRIHRTK